MTLSIAERHNFRRPFVGTAQAFGLCTRASRVMKHLVAPEATRRKAYFTYVLKKNRWDSKRHRNGKLSYEWFCSRFRQATHCRLVRVRSDVILTHWMQVGQSCGHRALVCRVCRRHSWRVSRQTDWQPLLYGATELRSCNSGTHLKEQGLFFFIFTKLQNLKLPAVVDSYYTPLEFLYFLSVWGGIPDSYIRFRTVKY